MKKYMKITVAALIGVLLAFLILRFWGMIITQISQHMDMFKRPALIQHALDQEEIDNIHWYGGLKRSFFACLAVLLIMGPSAIIFAWAKSHIEKSLVHVYKIGKYSEIPVHKRDMAFFTRAALPLINAEELKQMNAGVEKAVELYTSLADVQIRQARASSLPHVGPALPEAKSDFHTPTFGELLAQGEIGAGKPLIFGFAHNQARRGTWQDVYSNATGGQSGSGKTNSIRSMIAQSILNNIAFWVIDYHYPHPKSLLASLGPLRDSAYVKYCGNSFDTPKILQEVEETIERRKRNEEPSEPIRVLVIDELFGVIDACPHVLKVIEKIGTQGRKFNIFGMFAAHSWASDRIKSTSVRDNLTSIFAHKMKKQQARTLLQDTDQANIVKHLENGQCLFCPVEGMEEVLTVPWCSQEDIRLVANMVNAPVNSVVNMINVDHAVDQRVDHSLTSENQAVDLIDQVNQYMKNHAKGVTEFAADIEMDKGYLSKVLNRQKSMSDKLRAKFQEILNREKVIPFPQNH